MSEESTKSKSRQIDRIMAVVAIITLVIAWFVGASWAAGDIEPYLEQALPAADRFESISSDTYAVYQTGPPDQLRHQLSNAPASTQALTISISAGSS
jgi:hypothetical protein